MTNVQEKMNTLSSFFFCAPSLSGEARRPRLCGIKFYGEGCATREFRIHTIDSARRKE